MKIMVIERTAQGNYRIKVDGYSSVTYVWYSKKRAEREYRKCFNLQGNHFLKVYMGL